MNLIKKLGKAAIIAALFIGIGILQIKYPSTLSGFNDNYTGRGKAGFVVLLIELLFVLIWSPIGGILLISLTVLAIFLYLLLELPSGNTVKVEKNDNPSAVIKQEVFRLGIRAGKNFVEKRRHKQMQDEVQ